MGLNFGELHLEHGDRAITEVSVDGFFFQIGFKRLPDGTISDPIISGVGHPSDAAVRCVEREAKGFKDQNSAAIDAMLPRV
jgi:hypothetical protein